MEKNMSINLPISPRFSSSYFPNLTKEMTIMIMSFMIIFSFVFLCIYSLQPSIFMRPKVLKDDDEPEMEYNINRIFIISILFSCVVLLVSWLARVSV